MLLLYIGFKLPWNDRNHLTNSRQPRVSSCPWTSTRQGGFWSHEHSASSHHVQPQLLPIQLLPYKVSTQNHTSLQSPDSLPSSAQSLRWHFLSSPGAVPVLWATSHRSPSVTPFGQFTPCLCLRFLPQYKAYYGALSAPTAELLGTHSCSPSYSFRLISQCQMVINRSRRGFSGFSKGWVWTSGCCLCPQCPWLLPTNALHFHRSQKKTLSGVRGGCHQQSAHEDSANDPVSHGSQIIHPLLCHPFSLRCFFPVFPHSL